MSHTRAISLSVRLSLYVYRVDNRLCDNVRLLCVDVGCGVPCHIPEWVLCPSVSLFVTIAIYVCRVDSSLCHHFTYCAWTADIARDVIYHNAFSIRLFATVLRVRCVRLLLRIYQIDFFTHPPVCLSVCHNPHHYHCRPAINDVLALKGKRKEVYLYSAIILSISKRSDMDHIVLHANYTMSTFPS